MTRERIVEIRYRLGQAKYHLIQRGWILRHKTLIRVLDGVFDDAAELLEAVEQKDNERSESATVTNAVDPHDGVVTE